LSFASGGLRVEGGSKRKTTGLRGASKPGASQQGTSKRGVSKNSVHTKKENRKGKHYGTWLPQRTRKKEKSIFGGGGNYSKVEDKVDCCCFLEEVCTETCGQEK